MIQKTHFILSMIIKLIKDNQKGFSLLELLIYIAILSGFLLVIVNLFFIVSSSSVREEVRAEVRQNLRFSGDQIITDIRSASAISVPASGSGNTLTITVNTIETSYNVFGGVLQKTRNSVTENITTDTVTVDIANPIFTRIGDTIQINLKIDYNDNGRGDYKFFESVKTTASLRL